MVLCITMTSSDNIWRVFRLFVQIPQVKIKKISPSRLPWVNISSHPLALVKSNLYNTYRLLMCDTQCYE